MATLLWLAICGLQLLGFSDAARAAGIEAAQRDYLLMGAATTDGTPMRSCQPQTLAELGQRVAIPAPAGGWSGTPQAVTVFNVHAGEVMVALGGRQVCGRMHDARTRDSRFRASIGLVAVPPAGSREPVQVAWTTPLNPAWVPTVQLGEPSRVQQADTLRLLLRASCMTIALALVLLALMGGIAVRDRVVLFYAGISLLLLLWQGILNGLSGYPVPWLPLGKNEAYWLTAFSAMGLTAVLYGICLQAEAICWRPWMSRGICGVASVMLLAGLLTPFMTLSTLRIVAITLDELFALACCALLLLAFAALLRGERRVLSVVALVTPFVCIYIAGHVESRLLVAYRIEVIQLSITWCQIVMAYANAHRYGLLRQQRDAMRILADTDELTGLRNRRSGLARLAQCFEDARQFRQPLTLGFIDIDLFKKINDQHGHLLGDRVLVTVAKTLTASVREYADVIRMGGEEFLVLLPGVSGVSARQRLQTMQRRIGEACAKLGVPGLQVTASVGLASMNEDDDNLLSLLRRADNAMYRAKREGRNRVVDADNDAASGMLLADNAAP